MDEMTIQRAGRQQNLLAWSQRVADCRSSGLSVNRWCAEHGINTKTYYTWQKKVFAATIRLDIAAIARSILLLERDCVTPTIRYMLPIKASLAPEGPAIGFIIGDEQGFSWIGPCEHDTDNVSEQSKRTQAADEIQELLSVGEMESVEVLARLEELGISRRTAQTAKKDLGVEAVKRGGKWFWQMPAGDKEKNKDAEETVI